MGMKRNKPKKQEAVVSHLPLELVADWPEGCDCNFHQREDVEGSSAANADRRVFVRVCECVYVCARAMEKVRHSVVVTGRKASHEISMEKWRLSPAEED